MPWRRRPTGRLDYRFNFSLRCEIKGFVEIFRAVLLAANYPNALRDKVHQRDSKRLRVYSHGDEPAVFDLPRTAYSGYDCGLHNIFLLA
jgi:hypothetical protein